MQTTTLSFENFHNHGELFGNLFRARKQSFIVQKNWDLPEAMDMEYDQYDTPASRWIAIHEGGKIYAGIRLTPTTTHCGIYSYMIRDAQQGLLSSLPQDLLYENAPVNEQTWESSRVFVAHDTPQRIRRRVHAHLVATMLKGAREQGASHLVGIIAATWPRWLGRCGLEAKAIGRKLPMEDCDYQCVSIDLTSNLH